MFSSSRRTVTLGSFLKSYYSQTMVVNASSRAQFATISVTVPKSYVYHVELNRPDKLNAMNNAMWLEIGQCFSELGGNPDCRVVVLSAAGKLFTAGIDLKDMANLGAAVSAEDDVARRSKILCNLIKQYQDSITSLEKCNKPVITAIHNGCIGAGVNLITAADIRYCTKDAWFQVKEVGIGMAADVGVLQRLPKVIGSDSLVRELCYTARKFSSDEARNCGLVSRVYDDKNSMVQGALELAEEIAQKSPVAVQGTKRNLVFSRDHNVQDGLDHIRDWNMTMLQSEDFINATMAQATKGPTPTFSKL